MVMRIGLNSRDRDNFPVRSHDEETAAGSAFVIGVDPVVGLLFADVVESFVLAGRHLSAHGSNGIYRFGEFDAQVGDKR